MLRLCPKPTFDWCHLSTYSWVCLQYFVRILALILLVILCQTHNELCCRSDRKDISFQLGGNLPCFISNNRCKVLSILCSSGPPVLVLQPPARQIVILFAQGRVLIFYKVDKLADIWRIAQDMMSAWRGHISSLTLTTLMSAYLCRPSRWHNSV